MIVLGNIQQLALKLNNPAQVLASIPTAKQITLQGIGLVIVPHKADEVQVLRNLGLKAPAPILYNYDWPGEFAPYEHQRMTSAFLTMHRKLLVLSEIGTGKTNSALWAADYFIREGIIKKVLIISPLSTLERVWGDAIYKGLIHRTFVTLHGTSKRRHKLLATDVDFYVVNHDGFKVISDAAQGMFDLVIVDEAAVLRNPTADRYKMFRKWMHTNPDTRLWLMTGTPTPNAPTDAWTLATLVESPYVPNLFSKFRDQTMQKLGQYAYIPRPNSVDVARNVLYPAVRYTRGECFELPETVFQTREAPLTKEQQGHYGRMLKNLVTEAANGAEILAVNEAVKIQKLVQISCGVAYDDAGENVELDCTPRVNAVIEVIREAGGKVIVFVPLTGALHMLEKKLGRYWRVAVVNGAVSTHKRNKIFHDFQETAEPTVLIAHPATMAHGLTLTAASTIIWYGPITSNEQYTQANGRIERIGKHYTSNIVHIEGTALERSMYQRLKNKQKLQGLLLDLIRQEMEGESDAGGTNSQ